MSKTIIIGTRGSRLALWQANKVKAELEIFNFPCELKIIKTQGDKIQDIGFNKMEGKGFFTKEIESELLDGTIDVAVHSLKDLPTTQPEGLALAGLSQRADPADLLLIHPSAHQEGETLGLKPHSKIGTSSIRRKTQIMALAPGHEVIDLRGNVPTRVNKLREGAYDAIILARAGVNRLELDLSDLVTKRLHPKEMIPAAAQGVIAYQVRAEDIEMRKIISLIHHKPTAEGTNIERKVLQEMDGGCQVPLGVYCEIDEAHNYHLFGFYAPSESGDPITHRISQSTNHLLVKKMVEKLKAKPNS